MINNFYEYIITQAFRVETANVHLIVHFDSLI